MNLEMKKVSSVETGMRSPTSKNKDNKHGSGGDHNQEHPEFTQLNMNSDPDPENLVDFEAERERKKKIK